MEKIIQDNNIKNSEVNIIKEYGKVAKEVLLIAERKAKTKEIQDLH